MAVAIQAGDHNDDAISSAVTLVVTLMCDDPFCHGAAPTTDAMDETAA